MPVFFGVDGVWWSVAAAELLGVVLSVVLLVLVLIINCLSSFIAGKLAKH